MGIINTNIPALGAVRNLATSTKSLSRTLERLSTGFKINRASDGPAALVISERLRSQVAGLRQAVSNSDRAANLVATAEGALSEVNDLLVGIKDLILEAANTGALSHEEILANQEQVDSAVETINRIANTTTFAGASLFDGRLDYVTSGLAHGSFRDVSIRGAALTHTQSQISVNIQVTQNASRAILSRATNGIGLSGATLLIGGNKGTTTVDFSASAANSAILAAVNSVTDNTGVEAVLSGGSLLFLSEEYGSDQFVSVRDILNLSGASNYINGRDEGADAQARINGITAASRGLKVSINSFQLKADFTLSATAAAGATNASPYEEVFNVVDGGMTFHIGGGSASNNKEFIAFKRLTAENLGDTTNGFLSTIVTGQANNLFDNPGQAAEIVDAAIDDITRVRAQLGAFVANTLETNVNSLNVHIENLTAAESRIRDTDFAAETSEFTRTQILVQAGTSVLAQANLVPQSVLQLIG